MRSYPRNSPEAAARIVALVLVSDGHVCRTEMQAVQQLQLEHELGLAPGAFADVMRELCDDLLLCAYGSDSLMCSLDAATLAALLAELDEPALQRKVLGLAGAAAGADRHLADAEAMLLAAARQQWALGDAAAAPATRQAQLQPA